MPMSTSSRPRVLLIAYYTPPAGGPAVQRILQFVEYLADEGWAVEVLTVRNGVYPNRDPDLLETVPSSVRVHRTSALDPYAIYQFLTGKGEGDLPMGSMPDATRSWSERVSRWVRANIFIPDARVGWWPFAVARGQQLLRTGRFDAVISSGAPHSVHLIGRTLHTWFGTPWIADLHDPWTDISYYDDLPHTEWAKRIDSALERNVLSSASAVTTVSPSWVDLFREKATNDYSVIENGFRASEFDAVEEAVSDDAFVLAHVGKLYASRNPTGLWQALRELHESGQIPNFKIRLIGSVDATVEREIESNGLSPLVERVGFVSHEEAVRQMARSTLLLLVIEPFAEARGMITSKLYEYLASERPVLGVGPPSGDAGALIAKHNAGDLVAWDDVQGARRVLMSHYESWESGTPQRGVDRAQLGEHTRRHQARRMARVLDAVTGRA